MVKILLVVVVAVVAVDGVVKEEMALKLEKSLQMKGEVMF